MTVVDDRPAATEPAPRPPAARPGSPGVPRRGAPAPARRTGPPPGRRRIHGLHHGSVFNAVGAAGAGVAVALLLHELAGLPFGLGFVLVGYVAFLVAYGVLVSLDADGPAVRNALATALMTTCAVIAFGALAIVVVFTLARGWQALRHVNFFTQDLSKAGPLASLKVGGVGHGIVGTLWMVGIAVVLTVPIGLVAAVYLDVSRTKPSTWFRTAVEAMTALPSILAGLFIWAVWILSFGYQRSGLAAALALSVMMLPYIIRAADLALRLVPGNLREASAALGAPAWRTEWQVVIPTARSGLATAVILGIARAVGEASPVLLTAGYTTYVNANPLNGPMVSLPLLTLKLVQSGVPTYISRAFGAASVLLVLVIVLFVIARRIGGWGPGHLSPRGQRKVLRDSARDVQRFATRSARPAATGPGRSSAPTPAPAPAASSTPSPVPTRRLA